MNKLIFQSEHDALLEACGGMMTTLMGDDGGVKSAASDVFPRAKLAEYRPPKGKFMVHAVAMGADEMYSYNKNYDGFSIKDLREKHATFVTHGHMFREHVNRDPKKAIGQIKASAYHPDLHRVELVLWGDMEKAAKEYEALKSGKGVDWSMSCRLAYDVDNCCGHRAKSASEYCTHLKDSIGKYLPEFEKYAYALNPNPTFFDMSAVGNRADRIARHLQAKLTDGHTKSASAGNPIIYSSEWADFEGVDLPGVDSKVVPMSDSRRELLVKLASMEQRMEDLLSSGEYPKDWMSQFQTSVACNAFPVEHSITKEALSPARDLRTGTFFRELGKKAALLPPDVLWAYVEDKDPSELEMEKKAFGSLFRDLLGRVDECGGCGNLTDLCDAGSALSSDTDPEYTDAVDKLMEKADEQFGASAAPVKNRTMIQITITKAASSDTLASRVSSVKDSDIQLTPEQETLKALYGCYKLAAVEAIQELRPDIDVESLLALAVGQNIQYSIN